ncbi:Cytochrome b-c1 complex subunit 8 [Colletotrichum gloeosporioides]|uniref:Cytochrome b-c1 complex subunit 8 n=1 Tax=Colletotrichum gloeosporioides TaxID=474922 RepID=A0A8H4CRI4_COLGL|nr:Cytochrome b-c1 complex subunit 8 [Colletotrichum gloeosporioides]KAF3808813.1 Cytochrome b-c1 complex subunit 8 [Colletotrichum gloeosporioides]
MRPTQALASGPSIPHGKYSHHLGWWGHIGGEKQRGIITYGIAPNRQNPFAGAAHDAVFNTWRRFSAQVLYFLPPLVAGWYIMDWATHRLPDEDSEVSKERVPTNTRHSNHYLNSKQGRAEFGDSEE